MNCKNCGAEYHDTVLKCPYCGTENKAAAGRKKKEILRAYDEEAQRLYQQAENFPKRAAKRITGKILLLLAILAGVGLIVTVCVIFGAKISAELELKTQKKHLQKLEELYQKQDYEALFDYLDKKELYGRSYEKYSQVAWAAKYYEWMQEQLGDIEEIQEDDAISLQRKQEFVSWREETMLYYASYVLELCMDGIEDTVYLRNETVLSQFYEECVQTLKALGYEEEQIEILRKWDRSGKAEELW